MGETDFFGFFGRIEEFRALQRPVLHGRAVTHSRHVHSDVSDQSKLTFSLIHLFPAFSLLHSLNIAITMTKHVSEFTQV